MDAFSLFAIRFGADPVLHNQAWFKLNEEVTDLRWLRQAEA